MKRIKHNRRRRFSGPGEAGTLVSVCLMAIGYLLGCVLGARFGVLSDLPSSVVSVLTEQGVADENGLIGVFGGYGFYGLLFLLLSTTYLGFLFVPFVFVVKGFFTGAVFLTYMQSGASNAYLQAGIAILLPGLFVIPALLLLGCLCMRLSFQLLCRMRGAPPSGGDARYNRVLAVIFVLLLIAAAIETYAVPALIALVAG